jgi:murein DD-endopeptidase MepM/ murein hydrolase activator NlpD
MSKRWNIIVLPNTSERGFNISLNASSLMLGALVLVAILAGVSVWSAAKFNSWKKQHVMRVAKLTDEIQKRESDLATIEAGFQDLLTVEDKLRTIAGLQPRQLPIGEPGRGGKGGPEMGETLARLPDHNISSRIFAERRDTSPKARLEAMAAAYDGLSEILETFEREQERLSSIPSINPVYSPDAWISSSYGYRRDPITGQRRFHDGVDIVAPRKTPVMAPADGVVSFSGWRAGMGRMIEIRHGYGYTTIFAHNDKLSAKKGDHVKRGDTISLLGSSGRSTGPHLHYEVILDGKTKNPYKHVID